MTDRQTDLDPQTGRLEIDSDPIVNGEHDMADKDNGSIDIQTDSDWTDLEDLRQRLLSLFSHETLSDFVISESMTEVKSLSDHYALFLSHKTEHDTDIHRIMRSISRDLRLFSRLHILSPDWSYEKTRERLMSHHRDLTERLVNEVLSDDFFMFRYTQEDLSDSESICLSVGDRVSNSLRPLTIWTVKSIDLYSQTVSLESLDSERPSQSIDSLMSSWIIGLLTVSQTDSETGQRTDQRRDKDLKSQVSGPSVLIIGDKRSDLWSEETERERQREIRVNHWSSQESIKKDWRQSLFDMTLEIDSVLTFGLERLSDLKRVRERIDRIKTLRDSGHIIDTSEREDLIRQEDLYNSDREDLISDSRDLSQTLDRFYEDLSQRLDCQGLNIMTDNLSIMGHVREVSILLSHVSEDPENITYYERVSDLMISLWVKLRDNLDLDFELTRVRDNLDSLSDKINQEIIDLRDPETLKTLMRTLREFSDFWSVNYPIIRLTDRRVCLYISRSLSHLTEILRFYLSESDLRLSDLDFSTLFDSIIDSLRILCLDLKSWSDFSSFDQIDRSIGGQIQKSISIDFEDLSILLKRLRDLIDRSHGHESKERIMRETLTEDLSETLSLDSSDWSETFDSLLRLIRLEGQLSEVKRVNRVKSDNLFSVILSQRLDLISHYETLKTFSRSEDLRETLDSLMTRLTGLMAQETEVSSLTESLIIDFSDFFDLTKRETVSQTGRSSIDLYPDQYGINIVDFFMSLNTDPESDSEDITLDQFIDSLTDLIDPQEGQDLESE